MNLKARIKKLEQSRAPVASDKSPAIEFTPRPDNPEQLDQQTSFWADRSDAIICCLAGNGAGKTLEGTARVARFLRETPPPERNTPFWIASQNMEMATSVCWGQNLSRFVPPSEIQDIVWYSAAKGLPRTVVLRPHRNGNNYLIEFKSYDQGRQALQGSNIIGFYCDEQCPFEVLTELLARTRKWRTSFRQYTCTPLTPDPKLEEIYNERERYPDWHFYRMNTRLNDAINSDFVRQIEANELAELVETRLTGCFAVYQGSIYKDLNLKTHVIEPFEIPRAWTIYRGIDLGWSHGTACVWVAKDLEGRHYVFKEYLKSQTSIEAHVAAINEGWDEFPIKGGTWIDSANAQVVAEMELRGLRAAPAVKEVKAGIGTIQSLLRPGPDGKPKLYIFRTCENLIRQLRTYVWDEKRLDEPKKETATYLMDVADALRYALHSASQTAIKYEALRQPERRHKVNF